MASHSVNRQIYNNRRQSDICRNGTSAAYFNTKNHKYGYHAPPTNNQLNYISYLLHCCEKYGIPVNGLEPAQYRKRSGEAHRAIRRLVHLVCSHSGVKVRYVVLCKNLNTGETKKFLSPSKTRAPKGWELLGIIEKKIEFPNGEKLELNDEAEESIEYNERGLLI